MLENGDHANFVFAFFRPHVTSMSVLNTHNQPQTANPRIIIPKFPYDAIVPATE